MVCKHKIAACSRQIAPFYGRVKSKTEKCIFSMTNTKVVKGRLCHDIDSVRSRVRPLELLTPSFFTDPASSSTVYPLLRSPFSTTVISKPGSTFRSFILTERSELRVSIMLMGYGGCFECGVFGYRLPWSPGKMPYFRLASQICRISSTMTSTFG